MALRWSVGLALGIVGGCSQVEPPNSVPPEAKLEEQAGAADRSSDSGVDYTFGFEAREHQLWFQAGTDPQLYTVKSKDGEIVAGGIDDATLERDYPELHDIVHTGSDFFGLVDY